MRIHDITEAYSDIVKPLQIIATRILNMDVQKDFNDQIFIKPYFGEKSKNEIADTYGIVYYELMSYIERHVPIYFIEENSSYLGSYRHYAQKNNPSMDAIMLNLPKILPDYTKFSRTYINDPKVKQTLVHELRHVMQRQTFQDYYHSDTLNNIPYSKSPIEIDAQFVHILHDEPITDIHTFVNGVMDKFSKYKTLTDKQYRHYRNKAAAYFVNHDKEKSDNPTLKSRLDKLKQNKIDSLIEPLKNANIQALYDLRNVGSKGERFAINKDQFRDALIHTIKNNPEPNFNVAVSVAFLWFMYAVDNTIPVQNIVKSLSYDFDHLEKLLDNDTIIPFDKNLFVNAISSLKKYK